MAKRTLRRAIALGGRSVLDSDTVERVPLGVEGFEVTLNGLVVKGRQGFERCAKAGAALRVKAHASPFAIGDFILYVEQHLGEAASQIIDYSEGWNEKTCKVYRWVAERVAPERRRMDRLTYKHHEIVAKLSPAQQQRWLRQAANDGEEKAWTTGQLRAAMQAGGEVVEESWWVLVRCESAADQEKFMDSMTSSNRSCKAVVRRAKKAREAAA